jgi:hypothetical protein
MKNNRTSDWINLGLFTLFGLAVMGSFYVFAVKYIPPAEDIRDYYAGVVHFVELEIDKEKGLVVAAPRMDYKKIITLRIDETQSVGDVEVIFKGLSRDSRFKLDVAIPELDPNSFYSHHYTISEAREGIRIGNQKVKLLTARSNLLHLVKVSDNG